MERESDPHDGIMPMDFFVWVARSNTRTILIDAGSGEAKCTQRGHSFLRCPTEGLEALGIDPAQIDDIVITHMHWDHAGNLEKFPRAQIHLQKAEMQMVTGPDMGSRTINHFFFVNDVCTVIRRLYDGQVTFHEGESELAPGFTITHVGGHTIGLQIVRVYTRRGWVILASDASHFYVNFEAENPFPVYYNSHALVQGWGVMRRLADSPAHIVPGHDPEVLRRYPAAASPLGGQIVRLDVDPVTEHRDGRRPFDPAFDSQSPRRS